MKNLKYKILISVFIFITVAVSTVVLTTVKEDEIVSKTTMEQAKLPVVYMVSEGGISYNLLHGYATSVDENMLHECITPLPSDRKLQIRIGTYDEEVTGLEYEIRSLDGLEFIENTKVTDYKNVYTEIVDMGQCMEAQLNIKNLLEKNKHYMLKIIVHTQNKTANYYTRIIYGDNVYTDEKLNYVLHFSEVTYDDEAIKEIIPKLETNSTGDNTNLGHVNINSKLSQVGWGELEPEVFTYVWPTITEIDKDTADIRLDYQVRTPSVKGFDVYDVKEFFRTRRADEKTTYVLSYDRYVDQVFDGIRDLNESGRIYLGITSDLEDEKLICDSSGTVTCFLRRGELWSYNIKTNNFARIFSFVDDNSPYNSLRETYKRHGITVISVTKDGNVDFVVYGYMNRGSHEGELGVSLCTYDSKENIVDEILYIPRNEIFEVIERDVDTLAYLNDDGRFFIYQNESIYSIYYDTKEYMVVADNVINDSCNYSVKDAIFTYQEGDDINNCSSIKVLNLNTGETNEILVEEDECVKTLGLIDGNLVYGIAKKSEINFDENGIIVYPMFRLLIMDSNYEYVKKYEMDDIRVISANVSDNKIIVNRIKINSDGEFEPIADDQLMSKSVAADELVYTKYVATEKRQKEKYIMLAVSAVSPSSTKLFIPFEINFDEEAKLFMNDTIKTQISYRAYGMGELCYIGENLAKAIACANKWAGVVVNSKGDICWDRYKPASAKVAVELRRREDENLVKYEYDYENTFEIIGATLEESLYYIGEGFVLKIKTADGYVLVNEYDKNNVSTISLENGKVNTYSKNKFSEMISAMDNVIIVQKINR